MSAVRFCLLAVVLLALCATESRAGIDCYFCGDADSTATATGCGDPFSSSDVEKINCESGVCSKSKSSVAGIEVITRGCGTTPTDNTCDSGSVFGVSSSVCECSTSLCNSAVSVSRNQLFVFVLTTFAAAVALVIRRFG